MGLNKVLGQEKAIMYLRKLLETNNIPSTLLFVGNRGVGKFFTALQFAKALNCKVEPLNGCDSCKSCVAIENNVSPNVKIIKDSPLGIESIRDVINSSYMPINGYSVNIFVDVDSATKEAFNSMLKYLEEPPPKTLNILIAEKEEAIPETIISRSSIVRFSKLRREVIERILSSDLEETEAKNLSYVLNGSLENLEKFKNSENFKKRKHLIMSFLNLVKKNETVPTFLLRFKDYYGDIDRVTVEDFLNEAIDLMEDILYIVLNKETDFVKNIDLLGFIANEFLNFDMKIVYETYKLIENSKTAILTNANPMYIILKLLFDIEYL
ncbi:MAG: hypothetical protein K6343_00580 [Caldisericaceae bacterium]